MTKTVDFYFDFASPNAYLSHKVVSGIEERTGGKEDGRQLIRSNEDLHLQPVPGRGQGC